MRSASFLFMLVAINYIIFILITVNTKPTAGALIASQTNTRRVTSLFISFHILGLLSGDNSQTITNIKAVTSKIKPRSSSSR
jgi:hypothetical protein